MTTGSQNTQTMHLPIDGGIDQRTHPRQLQTPSVIDIVNARFSRVGSVDKRNGMTAINSVFNTGYALTSLENGRVMAFRDELLITDGFRVGSLSIVSNVNKLIDKGKVPTAVSTSKAIDTTQYYVSQPDVAYTTGGLVFHTWAANDRTPTTGGVPLMDIFWTVQNDNTGAELISVGGTTGGFDSWHPRLIAAGNEVLLAWLGSATTNMALVPWDPVNLVWGTPTGITDVFSPGRGFGMCTDGTSVFIVYQRLANTITIRKFSLVNGVLTLVATIDSTENVLPLVCTSFSCCATAGEVLWICYTRISAPLGTVNVRASCYNLTLSAETTAPFTVYSPTLTGFSTTGICRLSPTTAQCVLGIVDASSTTADGRGSYMASPVVSTAGAIVGSATGPNRSTYWCIPGSAPFAIPGALLRSYVWVYAGGARVGTLPVPVGEQPLQWTYMLVDLMAEDTSTADFVARPVTWQAPRFAKTDNNLRSGGIPQGPTVMQPPNVASLPNNVFLTDCIVRRNAATRIGLQEIRARFGGPDRFIFAELGKSMIMTPGFRWDRAKMHEISYAYWPQKMASTATAATGGFLANGEKYNYRMVYEYVDATGNVDRSQPSDPLEVTVAGAVGGHVGTVTLEMPNLCVTAKQDPSTMLLGPSTGIRHVIYRAGPLSIDPVTYYRVFSDNETPKNNVHAPTSTIVDRAADLSTVTTSVDPKVQLDTLYTMGGVLPNVMPAGFTSCVTYLGRVWVSYGNTVTYSKAFVTGDAVSFTDSFELPIEEGGDITALWVMDNSLYIATRDRIYYLEAYGPNDAGGASDVNIPNRVATDRGVIDQRSVVVTPVGTLYQSSLGIQMMNRNRSVDPEPIGSRIQDTLESYPEITSAVVHPSGMYVSFCARERVNSFNGIRIVYDYTNNRWSRDDLFLDSTPSAALCNEVVSRGLIYAGRANSLHYENAATYLDSYPGGTTMWVPLSVTLAEVHPAGLQGWLGFEKWTLNHERFSDHNITMSWYKDYATSPFESKTWLATALPVDENEQFSHNPAIHRAQSMRMKLTDASPTGGTLGIGRGAAFIGLAVEVDSLDNKTFRLPAARKG